MEGEWRHSRVCRCARRFAHCGEEELDEPSFLISAEIRIRSVSIFGFIREGLQGHAPLRLFSAITIKGPER
jgi:hypothetical protein